MCQMDSLLSWPSVRYLLGLYAVIIFGLGVLGKRADASSLKVKLNDAAFFLVGLVFFLLFRLPSIMLARHLNPDEAQMLAQAIKSFFTANYIPWQAFDPNSSGPLNSYILAWAGALSGQVPDYPLARTVAAILIWVTIFMVYKINTLFFDRAACLVGTLPVFLFYAFTENHDFLHYSSELLPLTLFAAAWYVQLSGAVYRPESSWPFIMAGFMFGFLPWIKLQFVLLTLFGMGTQVVLLLRLRRNRIKPLGLWLAAASLCSVLHLLAIIFYGDFADFFPSYLVMGRMYNSSQNSEVFTVATWWRFMLMDDVLLRMTVQLVLFAVSACLFSLAVRAVPAYRMVMFLGGTWLYFGVMIWTINLSGRQFSHYLQIFFPFLSILFTLATDRLLAGVSSCWASAGVALSATRWRDRVTYDYRAVTVSVVLLVLWLGANDRLEVYTVNRALWATHVRNAAWRSLIPAGATSVVWGWMPQLYVETKSVPALRDTIITYTHFGENNRCMRRVIDDILSNRPDFMVDAVHAGAFGVTDREAHGIHTVPEVKELLDEDYIVHGEVDGMTVYKRSFGRRGASEAP